MKNMPTVLLFIILVLPGFLIHDVYISLSDILIPLIFVLTISMYSFNVKLQINKINLSFLFYVLVCTLSVIVASISNGLFYGAALLKCFRLTECLMIAYLIKKWFIYCGKTDNELVSILKSIMIMGIISALAAIYLFLTQSMIFKPEQLMNFNGRVMRRAEGVFGDAQSFSYTMVIVFLTGTICFFNKRNRVISMLCMIITFFAIIFSDTRAAFFAITASIIFFLIKQGIFKMQYLFLFIAFIVAVVVLYLTNAYFNRFIDKRIFPVIQALLSFNYTNVSGVSSHRLEMWEAAWDKYLNAGFIHQIIGTGYKVDSADIADNSIVYSLVTTGIVGLGTLLNYWFVILKMLKKNGKALIGQIEMAVVVASLVFLFLCDSMTLYRAMYLVTFLVELTYLVTRSAKENDICKIQVSERTGLKDEKDKHHRKRSCS